MPDLEGFRGAEGYGVNYLYNRESGVQVLAMAQLLLGLPRTLSVVVYDSGHPHLDTRLSPFPNSLQNREKYCQHPLFAVKNMKVADTINSHKLQKANTVCIGLELVELSSSPEHIRALNAHKKCEASAGVRAKL